VFYKQLPFRLILAFIHAAADATAMREPRYSLGLGIEDANPKRFWLCRYCRLR